MSTEQLIQELEHDDFILPKDILDRVSEEQLIRELQEIYDKHLEKIEREERFRRKYTELVNFLLLLNLEKTKRKKNVFDRGLVQYLLSMPEAA